MGRKAHCPSSERLTLCRVMTGPNRLRLFVAIALAAVGAAFSTPAHSQPVAPVSIAKSCGAGYTHAIIGGKEKCLRAGEFCSHQYDSQYRRYGYRCIYTDANGRYHLTRGR
jgi:hypothetical protein